MANRFRPVNLEDFIASLFTAIITLTIFTSARADDTKIYKQVDENGHIIYSQYPSTDDSPSRKIETLNVKPANGSSDEFVATGTSSRTPETLIQGSVNPLRAECLHKLVAIDCNNQLPMRHLVPIHRVVPANTHQHVVTTYARQHISVTTSSHHR